MIKESFLFAGFSAAQPPIEQFADLINLGTAQAILYFVVVQHDAKVQMLRRQNLAVATGGEVVYNFVQECSSLFTIMLEEDPGYIQHQMMQDAGIMPVAGGGGSARRSSSRAGSMPMSN